jgi:hypothetical protein
MLMRYFTYAEAVRNNTPGFKYIAGSSFCRGSGIANALGAVGVDNRAMTSFSSTAKKCTRETLKLTSAATGEDTSTAKADAP